MRGSILRRGETLIYLPESAGDPAPVLLAIGGDCGETLAAIASALEKSVRAGHSRPVALIASEKADWDADYSPWPSACLGENRPFAGGARAYLSRLLGDTLPPLQVEFGWTGQWGAVGYSLGGLFALWAACESDVFTRAGSASGALWYPGFEAYFEAHFPEHVVSAYVSMGRQEAKVRAPAMAQGAQIAQRVVEKFAASGREARFEWRNGNHFYEVPQRVARAVEFLYEK